MTCRKWRRSGNTRARSQANSTFACASPDSVSGTRISRIPFVLPSSSAKSRHPDVRARIVEREHRRVRALEKKLNDRLVVLGLPCVLAEHDQTGTGGLGHGQHAFRDRAAR